MATLSAELVQVRYQKMKNMNFCVSRITDGWCHEHSCLEIGLVLRGNVRVTVAEEEFAAAPGELLLFNAYEPHTLCSADGADVLFLQLAPGFGKEYFARVAGVEFRSDQVRLLPDGVKEQILQPLYNAAVAFFSEPEAFGMECMGWVAHMFTAMLRGIPYQINTDAEFLIKKKKVGRHQRIAGFVERHYREKLTLAHLAKEESITTAYMSRIFGELFHTSFQDYLSKLRLQKALPMLKKTDVYLVDICMECGFSDTRYLNGVCQKEYGCSALELREQMQDPNWRDPKEPPRQDTPRYTDAECLQLLQAFVKSMLPGGIKK